MTVEYPTPTVPDPSQVVDAITKPLFRGVSHLIGFVVSLVTGALLIIEASATVQVAASIIYSGGLALALGTSAAYHRVRWSSRAHPIIARIDHSMIFVLVAASYTPYLLISMDGWWRVGALTGIWTVTAIGITLRLAFAYLPRVLLVSMYVGMGWAALSLLPHMYHSLQGSTLWLLASGGVLYTIGGFVYLLKWPNPFPRTFGFHEIFHAFVIAAATCHYIAVYPLIVKQL